MPDPMNTPPTHVEALTAQWVLDNFLPGLPLENSQGQPMTPTLMNGRIKGTVAAFERKYSIRLAPTIIKVGTDPLEGEPPDEEIDERFRGIDFHPDGNLDNRFHSMRLPIGPVRHVITVGLRLPGMLRPARLPQEWVSLKPRSHLVRFYPNKTLSFAVVYTGGFFLNIHSGHRPIPEAWHLTYEAGHAAADLNGREYDVLEALGKMVAMELLTPGSLDPFLAEGVSGKSISVDGLAQSIQLLHSPTTLKYTNVMMRLAEELAGWEKTFWARKGGVRMAIL